MLNPTEGQYLSALETVKAYELTQETLFQEKVDLIKVDLDEFFKTTDIKKYSVKTSNWLGNKGVFIFPTEPYYDEDYCGEYDEALKEISNKHNVKVKMDSIIYSK
jgi:hypothetical protein